MRRITAYARPAAAAARRQLLALGLRLRHHSAGQGLVEYGLILVLIMVVCVAILTMTGQTISEVWYTKLIPALDR